MASHETRGHISDAETTSMQTEEIVIVEKTDLCNRIVVAASPAETSDTETS